jgi:hypothetical protein
MDVNDIGQQVVLALEMIIECSLGNACLLGDEINTDTCKALSIK